MRITEKLAYSQLKINKSRTLWSLIAIAMSTALTTAVCSFVVSGKAMLVRSLGNNYSDYASTYMTLLLIPAIIFGIIIISMSVVVISNVFRISAQERIAQFGILKCTGATKKQIIDTVMYESIFLSVIAIPAGIIIGIILTLGGIRIANHYLDGLNALVHMMVYEITMTLTFVLSWKALLLSAVISFITVIFSAWKPAHKAARVSAIDCIRGDGTVKIDRKQVRTNQLINRYFGFEGTLAAKNMKRSRRNFRATVVSLSVGVILFVSLGGLSQQARELETMLFPKSSYTVVADYSSSYAEDYYEQSEKTDSVYAKPIDSEIGNKMTFKLQQYDPDILGMGGDLDTYHTVLSEKYLTPQMTEALKYDKMSLDELGVEIIVVDQIHYEELCKKANAPIGSTLLLNHYKYNDFGTEINLEPFTDEFQEVDLIKEDGSCETVKIGGILTKEDVPAEFFYPNIRQIRLVMQRAMVRGFDWYTAPVDIDTYMEVADTLLNEEFPTSKNASYMEDGFTTRVYRTEEYSKVMNIAIALVSVFMYSFVILLMVIGLSNVISTLSTNVLMRAREFAVLKSVGMTSEGLKRMLNFESILCSMKALLYGLPIGIAVTFFVNLPIRIMFPIPYRIPWSALFLCVIAVFLITISTTRYAAHKLKKQNIIETIRSESGR